MERFPRPLFHDVRWKRVQRRERTRFAVRIHGAQRNKGLPSPASRNHLGRAGLIPSLHDAHDGKRLGGKRLPKQFSEPRRRRIVDLVKGWISTQNAFTELYGVSPEVVVQIGHWLHRNPSSGDFAGKEQG